MAETMTELLPCPFCGGEAKRITLGPDDGPDNEGGDVIVCTGVCGASSHVEFGRKENLASLWNNRALVTDHSSDPTVRERVARKLCEMMGGEPDALATDPHDSWDGPLWSVFAKDADEILALANAAQHSQQSIAEMEEALERILRSNDEAPDFGMCDCRDNDGEWYQSADLAATLIDARAALERNRLTGGERS